MISLNRIRKVYDTGAVQVEAIRDISLEIENGEMVAVMGPSGSGKSTLMNMMGCLDVPTGGSYCLNGVEVASLGEDELADIRSRNIGFVFQTFNLLPKLTALQNVELPMAFAGIDRGGRNRRARELLTMVELEDRIHHRPYELSGGQQQRVAIARALANKPSVVLADEPTGNLDSQSGDEIMDIFKQLNSDGITLVIITHEAYIAACAGRVIHIKDGMVAATDTIVEQPGGPAEKNHAGTACEEGGDRRGSA